MKQIIPLFITALLFLAAGGGIAPSSAAADANIVVTEVTPTDLSPGDIKEIALTVKNEGGCDARHITIWKGSHHRVPFHFKYGWFTPSCTIIDMKYVES
uniref:CARDB domain-containing protein n=1 Tax=Candidatus Methanophagaceae archaeon ANME-1 ERB6 TaxID=2759912 RepID=A0A7G9YZN5_9EURY|nr:hypothetical protein HCHKDHBN_00040 [Methanosarcinales archaeon ANME-1 ERB6]